MAPLPGQSSLPQTDLQPLYLHYVHNHLARLQQIVFDLQVAAVQLCLLEVPCALPDHAASSTQQLLFMP